MKLISLFVFVCAFMLMSVMGYSAELAAAPKIETKKVTDISEIKVNKTNSATSQKYCCTSSGGHKCYVFGDASCSNCSDFCNGTMVIESSGSLIR